MTVQSVVTVDGTPVVMVCKACVSTHLGLGDGGEGGAALQVPHDSRHPIPWGPIATLSLRHLPCMLAATRQAELRSTQPGTLLTSRQTPQDRWQRISMSGAVSHCPAMALALQSEPRSLQLGAG
jgi:hypothetical protein